MNNLIMSEKILENLLVCPKCQTPIKSSKNICKKCQFKFKKEDGIWQFLHIKEKSTKKSQKEYDRMHADYFGGPQDGSYEILAAIAKGNRAVDIACGEGLIENLSPQTVGVEFSLNALKKAKENGVKHLVLADAQALPFKNDSFDISISAGSLEHFENPQKAIEEMARISKIQVLTVHRHPPIPFAQILHKIATKILNITHQPLEQPVNKKELYKMLENSGLKIIFKGSWTLPFNYGRVIKYLPETKRFNACHFVISIKK